MFSNSALKELEGLNNLPQSFKKSYASKGYATPQKFRIEGLWHVPTNPQSFNSLKSTLKIKYVSVFYKRAIWVKGSYRMIIESLNFR